MNYDRRTPYNKDIFAPFSPSRISNIDGNKSNNSSNTKQYRSFNTTVSNMKALNKQLIDYETPKITKKMILNEKS
jgi:hypothetical protein